MIRLLLSLPARFVHWLRTALVVVALVFFAGITTKIVVSGGLPFGWSDHTWSLNVTFGHVLQNLAYAICLLAILSRLERRFVVGAVVLALAFPTGEHSMTLITAMLLISLPLWIGLRTLDHLRYGPVVAGGPLRTHP